jgi:sporulation integral membrane protein YtvI
MMKEDGMRESKVKTYIKILINFIFVIAVALFALLVLPKLLGFFLPFVIGWIVSMIANPLVRFLEKRVKILRKHSSAIIIVVVIAVIVGALALIITITAREVKGLMEDLPDIIASIGDKFTDAMQYIRKLSETLPTSLQNMINKLITSVENYVSGFADNKDLIKMNEIGEYAQGVAEGFLFTIVTVLSAYFFTACRDELIDGLKKHLPGSVINYWKLIYDNFKAAVGGYFKAQFKIMLILTVIMFIGFEVLQIGYSFVIALGIALLDFLPVFGTGAILWPWAVIDMITGNYIRAVGMVVIYLICQVVKQILQPKMVGDSIGLHPLATLVFLFIGYQLYGVFGMIIGIPIGMVLVNLYRVGMFDRLIRGFKIIAHDLNEFRKF